MSFQWNELREKKGYGVIIGYVEKDEDIEFLAEQMRKKRSQDY